MGMIGGPFVRGTIAKIRSRGGSRPYECHSESALDFLSRVPILGIVGGNGSGKSLLACLLCMRSLAAGRPVLSTVRLLDWENPRECPGGTDCDDPDNHELDGRTHGAAHPGYVRWTRWGQVNEMGRRFDVWADEITGVASSRDATGLPKAAQNLLVQLRRNDAVMRWTSPSPNRADVILREVSQGIVACRGYVARIDPDSGRRWPQKRLFRWRMYDTQGLQDFTWSQLLACDQLAETWFWGPRSDVFDAYDTFAPVSVIGKVSVTGVCEVCDGTRRRHECTCADYQAERQDARQARPGAPRQRGAAALAGAVASLVDETTIARRAM
ncbi:MAG: hypothetical protein QM658_16815 [Gordonia sp. (in: high G+C Gram-positive bacteria)]